MKRAWFPMLALLLTGACGGGGSGGATSTGGGPATPPTTPPSTPPPGPATGAITHDAVQIVQNGVCTSVIVQDFVNECLGFGPESTLTFDGEPQPMDRLFELGRNGSVAIVLSDSESTITTMDVHHVAVGKIETVDPAHARFTVLGVPIYVSDTTSFFSDDGFNALRVGDTVSVSGYFSAKGEVLATAIASGGDGFLLRGIVQGEDSGLLTVGSLAISNVWGYSWVAGDAVLVRGVYSANGDPEVTSEEYLGGALGDGAESVRVWLGMISRWQPLEDLEVDGRSVDCTVFPCASLVGARAGSLVGIAHAEGDTKLELRPQYIYFPYTLIGPIGAIDEANDAFTILGFSVQVLPTTSLTDDSGAAIAVGELEIGDRVAVVGGPVGDVLVAREVTASNGATSIWSRYVEFDRPEIRALGQTFVTDATTPVSEICTGSRDQQWLFDSAERGELFEVLIELGEVSGDSIRATRIEADTTTCSPWAY
jgi:hypothetical protein